MEKIMESKFVKIVIVTSILASILISYMPLISNATENIEAEYVAFEASYNKGGDVVSNQSVAFSYTFKLTGIQTGFKNVTLSIKDEDSTTPIATIFAGDENKLDNNTEITNCGRYSIIGFGNVRTGTDFSGTVNIEFDRTEDLTNYKKTITFLLETEYRNPITGITEKESISRDVMVNVIPAPIVDEFMADVKIEQNKYTPDLGEQIPGNDYLGAHYAYKINGSEYAIDEVSASYNVKINAENLCYGKYVLTVSKSPEFKDVEYSDTNLEENLIINLDDVPQEFNKNVVRNSNGKTDIELTYKTQKDAYTIDDMDQVTYFDFNIKISYKIKYAYTYIVTAEEETKKTFYNSYVREERTTESSGSEIVTTIVPPTSGGPYLVFDYKTRAKNNIRENAVLASRSDIDREKILKEQENNLTQSKDSKAKSTGLPIALLAETTVESGTEMQLTNESNSYNSETGTIITSSEQAIVTIYSKESVTETTETIEITQTDKLVTDLGSVVNIDGKYKAHSEGIDIETTSEANVVKKRSVDYTNSSSTSFLSASVGTKTSGGSEIYGQITYLDEALQNIENDQKIKVTFSTKANIVQNEYDGSDKDIKIYNYNEKNSSDFWTLVDCSTGNLYYDSDCRPAVTYVSDENITTTVMLDATQLKVESIEIGSLPSAFENLEFYERGGVISFYDVTSGGMSYTVPEGKNISEFYMKANIGENLGSYTALWYTTYSVSVESLKTLGLSDNEIKNIKSVSRYQYGVFDNENCTMLPKGIAQIIDPDSLYPKLSYFELSAVKTNESNFNTTNNNMATEPIKITLSMYKNTYVIKSAAASVYNVNPTFYIKLPKVFDFENFKLSISDTSNIAIKNSDKVTINSEEYLKIECQGIFNSTIEENVTITVNCYRTLIESTAQKNQILEAFMITENENYQSDTFNIDNLTYGEVTPNYLQRAIKSYTIEQSNLVQAYSKIKVGRLEYTPNSGDGKSDFSEKEMPVITKANATVNFIGELNNVGKSLSDVILMYKLPVTGSTEVLTDSKLIEDGYTLSADFTNKYSSILNEPSNTDGTVKKISLTNLKDIKVYSVKNGVETELDTSKYTLFYSEDINAGFDSDEATFIKYEEDVTDISNAAVLQIKLNNVAADQSIRVRYTMDMPEDGGMAGAIFGAKYTQAGDTQATKLDSGAVYVISGNSDSSIEIQKKFEGYDLEESPDGISLSGIEFKLKDDSGNFVQLNGTDLIAITNESGIATFSNLEPGKYQIVETSEIDGFETIGDLAYLNVKVAEKVEYEAVNLRSVGSLNIQKYFEDTNEIKGNAIFQLIRKTSDKIIYVRKITTDSEGKATIVGIPYGEYELTEVSEVKGYGIPETQTITIDQETVDTEVTNPLGKGTVIINKTVPDTENVKELSFDIKGIGLVSYINKQNETVTNDLNTIIKLNEDYSSNKNILVEIGADEKSAKITVKNLPLGFYTIQETDMPKIGDDEEDKYPSVTRTVSLENDGAEETINIINKKKTGILKIEKTAYIQSEENKDYIGDLSNFKVKITGTSDYGTVVNKTITLDEDGYATTSLEIGTYNVAEVPIDGYDVYYKNAEGSLIYSTTGTDVKITYNSVLNKANTTVQEIENSLTGKGYVRIEKTLDGITDPQTVLNAGIKFKIVGKNAAGVKVEETILIDKIDETKNVAYGLSNGILVNGEYQLEEMESTIPEYYEGIVPQAITVTTANTADAPLVINVENKKAKGNLQMITKTEPEGGSLTGISYRVTEVIINNDGTFTKLDGTNGTDNTVQEVEGDNGTTEPSYAEIKNLNAGNYLVELVNIPSGYKKDMGQVVEVPAYGIGNAIFTLEKDEFNKYTKLIISKEIVNSDNEIASQEDFDKAQLNIDENFEVKITNVNTKQKYYTFISADQKGIIADLPAGVYEIEEQYKPKYELKGYYNVVDDITTTELIKTTEGNYTFEIKEGTNELINITQIKIKNQINTNFPFGGQNSIENLSKVNKQEIPVVTQAVIYVIDEQGNSVPGAQFKIVNSEGKQVNLGTIDNVLTTVSEKIIIKGLEPGTYSFINVSVPDGYLKPDTKEFEVYSSISRVARIEIQKDILRGTVTLSTTYKNEDGETTYVPRSSYKVVNNETGELVKFTKTATGDYKKSNLEDASEVLTVKAGNVELQGLEEGTYEIGLVGLTDGYGMQNELPETVELFGNDVKNINVEVIKPKVQKISAGYNNTMYLDDSGQLWTLGANYYGAYGNGATSSNYNDIPTKVEFPEENVIIADFKHSEYTVTAIDNKGRVWSWGNSYGFVGFGTTQQNALIPVCLSEIEGTEFNKAYKNGVTVKEVQTFYNGSMLLDSDGRVWIWGYNYLGAGESYTTAAYTPICITEIEGSELKEAYDLGIKVEKLANMHGTTYTRGFIDSLGRVWMWGQNYNGSCGNGNFSNMYFPTCISEIESEFSSAEIVDLSIAYDHTLALDKDGNVWGWGGNSYGQLGSTDSTSQTMPVKLSSNLFDGAGIRGVYAFYDSGDFSMFIDEYGKVWFCGYNSSGQARNNSTYVYTPVCLSEGTDLSYVNVIDLSGSIYSGDFVLALDSNGAVWGWGGYSNSGEIGATLNSNRIDEPRKITLDYTEHLEYNLKFVKMANEYNSAIALDELGNVWGIGRAQYIGMGYKNYETLTDFTLIKDLEGKNVIDIAGGFSDSYICLTQDGNVYIMGYMSNSLSTDSSNSQIYSPLDITEKFNIDSNEKIIDIAMGDYAGAVLDSSGKVWTWGNGSYYQLGNGSTSNSYDPICISDDIGEELYNVKIKSIYGARTGFFAIDEHGKIWYWGEKYNCGVSEAALNANKNYDSSYSALKYPTCITEMSSLGLAYDSGIRFKNISATNEGTYVAALDNSGKLWVLYGYDGMGNYIRVGNGEAVCINDIKDHVINNESLKYENYKIEKIYQCYNMLYFTDNQGVTWGMDQNGTRKITDMYNVPNDIKYIDYYNSSYAYLIDGYGQIWQFVSGEPRCLSGVILNPLYNVKAKNIISEGLVEADTNKGEIYSIDSSNVKFMMNSERYVEDYKGKKIVQIEKNITNTFSNNYFIALDEEGKLWTWGGTEYPILGNGTTNGSSIPICISDIAGSELCNAYQNDANFRIEKFILIKGDSTSDDSYVIAVDNNNMLWTWGENKGGQLGNGTKETIYSPVCISKIENSELSQAYENNSNFMFTRIETYSGRYSYTNGVMAIDNSGELWKLGFGTMLPVCLTKQESSDLYKEKENCNVGDLSNFIIEDKEGSGKFNGVFNGKLWSVNYAEDIICFNFIENSELYNESQNGVTIEKIYSEFYGANFAIDSNGKLWSWGDSNSYGELGNNSTSTSTEPKCISNIQGTALYNAQNETDLKIESINKLSSYVITAIDSNGHMWIWGKNQYGELGTGTVENVVTPTCITSNFSEATVKKVGLYETSYYLQNYGATYGTRGTCYGRVLIILDSNGYMWTAAGNDATKNYSTNYSSIRVPSIAGNNGVGNRINLRKVNVSGIKDFAVKKYSYSSGIVAYGDNGVYAWGHNMNGNLGLSYVTKAQVKYPSGSSSYYYINYWDIDNPTQISSKANIDKIAFINNNYTVAIDTQGKVWAWGQYIPNYSTRYSTPTCISDIESSVIYGKTIVDGYEENGYGYIKDSDGVIYYFNGQNITAVSESSTTTVPIYTGTLANKTIVSNSNYMAIDSEGYLYGWDGYDGSYNKVGTREKPVCITQLEATRESNFKNNKTLVNVPIENELYNVKFADIINDQFVQDENGDYWFFPENGVAINLSNKVSGKDNELYGKNIINSVGLNYVVTSENEIYRVNESAEKNSSEFVMKLLPNDQIQDIKYAFEKAGQEYYIVLDKTGKIWACGNGLYGQLGNGSVDYITEPVCISDIEGTDLYNEYKNDSNFEINKIELISNGKTQGYGVIALDSNGKLWTWGYNASGELGNNTLKYVAVPICISNIAETDLAVKHNDNTFKIIDFKVYYDYNKNVVIYANDSNGNVWSWGYNKYGNVGNGTTETVKSPICINGIDEISNINDSLAISSNYNGTSVYIINDNGKLWAWGSNSYGQLGNGSTTNTYLPQCISDISTINSELYNAYQNNDSFAITKIICGEHSTYALDNAGKVWSWGYNSYGQLGNGSTTTSSLPICISDLQDVNSEIYNAYQNDTDFGIVDLVASDSWTHVLALDNAGKVWSWGYNSYGQLGNGSTTNTSSPVCISNIVDETSEFYNAYQNDSNFGITKIICGQNITYALDNAGRVWSWGYNSYGQLGNGTKENVSKPQCITDIVDTELNNAYLNNVRVTEIIVSNYSIKVLCDNGDTYYCGQHYINGISTVITTPTKCAIDISKIISIQNYGKQISEILDQTHIKDTEGKIYVVSSDGTLTELSTYTPEAAQTYEPITIEGVNVIDYAKYKALDDQGNLYVWNMYLSGLKTITTNVEDAINLTENEYIVEPLYLETNGWSIVKALR